MKNPKILEKATAEFVQKLAAQKAPPIYKLPVADARKVLETLQVQQREKLSVQIEDKMIPGGSLGKISVRIIRPMDSNGLLPVIVYFHGGGWILGSKETHDRFVRELSIGAGAAVVFVNYTPSPEAKFPTAIEQGYATIKYIAEYGRGWNLDATRLAVAGDSAGGALAIGTTFLAKERSGPKICYQALFYPVTDANFNTRSYKEFAKGPWLTKEAMKWFWNAYEPNLKARKKPLVAPLQAKSNQLRDLPPALIITDENDVLRDEGEAYAHRLMQAGVEVTVSRFLGTIHDFLMLNPLSATPATRGALLLATTCLRKAFSVKMNAKEKRAA